MRRIAFAALALCAFTFAFAQSGDMKSKGEAHRATGVVTKVDKDKVTIRLEPVPSLNWPTMTMAFKTKDKEMADKMKPGSKVDFVFVKSGADYVITDLK